MSELERVTFYSKLQYEPRPESEGTRFLYLPLFFEKSQRFVVNTSISMQSLKNSPATVSFFRFSTSCFTSSSVIRVFHPRESSRRWKDESPESPSHGSVRSGSKSSDRKSPKVPRWRRSRVAGRCRVISTLPTWTFPSVRFESHSVPIYIQFQKSRRFCTSINR